MSDLNQLQESAPLTSIYTIQYTHAIEVVHHIVHNT